MSGKTWFDGLKTYIGIIIMLISIGISIGRNESNNSASVARDEAMVIRISTLEDKVIKTSNDVVESKNNLEKYILVQSGESKLIQVQIDRVIESVNSQGNQMNELYDKIDYFTTRTPIKKKQKIKVVF